MSLNQEIFREYDIRGIVTRDLTDDVVLDLGRAIGTYFKRNECHKMVLGRDCRLSSNQICRCLIDGLMSTGMRVTDIGVVPTPLTYFALHQLDVDGGVMITGSHNPPEYNGFKIAKHKTTIYGKEIQKLAQIMEKNDYERGTGSKDSFAIVPSYMKYVIRDFSLSRACPIEVAVDAGNGTGGVIAVPLLEQLGVKVRKLFCEMDGHFPNHHPDPTIPKNLEQLIYEVKKNKLAAGIAYDGDADRIGVIDDKGNIIWGDKLMILFSRSVLKTNPGATIIGEVKCSQTLYDDVAQNNGRPIMWKTGHSLIKAKMKEEAAALAGEMSGHMFFADRYFGYDDALYATCRLVEILDKEAKPLSELLADVPKTYATPEIRIDCKDEKKFNVVQSLTEYFRSRYDIADIDGVRVHYADGWALVRASNTSPVLVLRFEAQSNERLREIRDEVESILKQTMEALG